MSYIVRFFTWWNKATLSTGLWTLLYGERVGQDEFGNVYYRRRGGKIDPALGDRAPLGDLQWIRRGVGDAARLVRLAAPYIRHASDAGRLQAERVGASLSGKSHWNAARLSPAGIDAGVGPTAPGRRRLRGLAARGLIRRFEMGALKRRATTKSPRSYVPCSQ